MTTPIEHIPLKTIDGKGSSLAAFAGQVRLVVNVASRCGLTPQYSALEALHEKHADRGLAGARISCQRVRRAAAGLQCRDPEVLHVELPRALPDVLEDRREGCGAASPYAALTSARRG